MDNDLWWEAPFVVWVSIPYEGWHPEGYKRLSEAIAAGREYETRTGRMYVVTAGVIAKREDM